MSSISAMGPHFFHWENKLWVRGGRSRLALSENIEIYFFRLSMTGSCPQNLPTWETHIHFSIFFEKSKNVVNPMVWRCREFFISKIFVFLMFPTRFFSIFIFWCHFCILRNKMLCPEDKQSKQIANPMVLSMSLPRVLFFKVFRFFMFFRPFFFCFFLVGHFSILRHKTNYH